MIGPSSRLVRCIVGWTAGALLAVLFPWLSVMTWAALALLVAAVGADLFALLTTAPPRAHRQLPSRAVVGERQPIAIVLDADRAAIVDLIDEVPADLRVPEPRFDRIIVRAGRSIISYEICPQQRGNRTLGPLWLLQHSPLDLLRRRFRISTHDVLPVYPDTSVILRSERLNPRTARALLGIKPAARRGEGTEFESLRDYVSGDDPRRIYWAASARRGRLAVRVHQHERNHSVIIAVDQSRLMGARIGDRTKLDYAIDATLALASAALTHGDRVGVVVFDSDVTSFVMPRHGRQQLNLVMSALQPLTHSGHEASYRHLVKAFTRRQRQRCVLIVLTDFVEIEPESIVLPLSLLARQHRLLVTGLRDPLFGLLDPRTDERGEDRLYRRLVLHDLANARDLTFAQLRRSGAQTIDLEPRQVTTAVVNSYFAIRYGSDR